MARLSATIHGPFRIALTIRMAPVVGSLSIRRKPRGQRVPGAAPAAGLRRTGSLVGADQRDRARPAAPGPRRMKPSAVAVRKWITGRKRCSSAATIGPIRRAMR